MLSKLINFLFAFVTAFFLVLGVLVLLSPYIYIAPTLGISECYSFVNGTFDPSNCKVIPGSLAVIVLKTSPLFSYYNNTIAITFFKTLALYLLVLSVASLVGFVLYYYKNKIKVSILFLIGAIVSLFFALIFLSPVTKGNIVCYTTTIQTGNTIIVCHTLKEVKDGYVILEPSRYLVQEVIPEDRVIGKIAVLINPPFGLVAYVLQFVYNVAKQLINIVGSGNIPIGYKIYYIPEK